MTTKKKKKKTKMTMTFKVGTVLLAGEDSDAVIEDAKQYISDNGLTNDDVKIVREDGAILVKTIRELEL